VPCISSILGGDGFDSQLVHRLRVFEAFFFFFFNLPGFTGWVPEGELRSMFGGIQAQEPRRSETEINAML
jgi:hypothetical protein